MPRVASLPIRQALLVVVVLNAWCCAAQGWPGSKPNSPVRNLTVALGSGPESEPAAILRADRIFQDYQRRGFFRIGALPLLVFEGLNLEIRRQEGLPDSLCRVEKYLTARSGTREAVEGRGFCLSFGNNPVVGLRARRLHLSDQSTWILRDGCLDQPEGQRVDFTEARLTVTGPHAGDLVCESRAGKTRCNLVALASTDHSAQNHENPSSTNP